MAARAPSTKQDPANKDTQAPKRLASFLSIGASCKRRAASGEDNTKRGTGCSCSLLAACCSRLVDDADFADDGDDGLGGFNLDLGEVATFRHLLAGLIRAVPHEGVGT